MSSPREERSTRPARPPRGRSAAASAPPTRASLHEAALAYLARGAASADSVRRTLERRTSSWARRALRAGAEPEAVARDASAAREHIGPVVARLCEVGLVDDASFAQARARRMASGGRSRRAIAAHLAQKGVAPDAAREAVVAHDGDAELDAAIAFARKRRVGPFAREAPPPGREERRAAEQKTLGAMARAGFDFATCERVLRMDRDDAEERLRDRRDF